MQFRVIVVTDPPIHPQTNRQDQLQYTASQLPCSVNMFHDIRTTSIWNDDTCSTAIYRTTRHQNVSILDFIAARDERGGGDNWSYMMCKIPVKSSLPINQYSAFYKPNVYLTFLLPDQQCQSTEKLKRSRTDINSTELWKLYGRFS